MDKEEETKNRPHFSLIDVKLHEVPIEIYWDPSHVKTFRIGVVKVLVKNLGTMNAKNARVFFQFGKQLHTDFSEYAVWGSVQESARTMTIKAPTFTAPEFMKISNESIAELLREEYFPKHEFGNNLKIEIPPGMIGAACLFYAIEGDNAVHMTLTRSNSQPFPIDDGVVMTVVMDDTPESLIVVSERLLYESWNKVTH